MSTVQREEALIKISPAPVTVESIRTDLVSLGLKSGSVVLVHTALSKLGWVCGGPAALVLALEAVLGPEGTLVMPTHSGDNSNPENWQNPPVPVDWIETIRATMPAYDPSLTPTRGMGKVPETFRSQSGTIRSAHPQLSFAARGAKAQEVTANHELEIEMGAGSPLDHIYDLDGWILLIGVGFGNNTSLHLAEHKAEFPAKKYLDYGCAMLVDGKRKWVSYQGFDYNDEDFVKIGEAFMQEYPDLIKTGKIGLADAMLMPQRAVVDFAVLWMNKNRNLSESE